MASAPTRAGAGKMRVGVFRIGSGFDDWDSFCFRNLINFGLRQQELFFSACLLFFFSLSLCIWNRRKVDKYESPNIRWLMLYLHCCSPIIIEPQMASPKAFDRSSCWGLGEKTGHFWHLMILRAVETAAHKMITWMNEALSEKMRPKRCWHEWSSDDLVKKPWKQMNQTPESETAGVPV